MAGKRPISFYYILLFIVIFVWGFDPSVCKYFYKDYSASVVAVIATVTSFIFFACFSLKKFKDMNLKFLKIAAPIGFLNGLAGLLQRIGLQYTSPANFAFLEHLAVATVPIVLFILIRKKPTVIQVISVVLCLVGCFILSGMTFSGFEGNTGDILCALSGIIYGLCVALIGVHANKIDASLYMVVFTFIYSITSIATMILLNNVEVNGVPIEPIRFTFDIKLLVPVALFGLFTVGITWLLKTVAIKKLDPTFVAIVSPFTAVVAGALSVITKTDELTTKLIIGAVLIMAAAILSGVLDVKQSTKKADSK